MLVTDGVQVDWRAVGVPDHIETFLHEQGEVASLVDRAQDIHVTFKRADFSRDSTCRQVAEAMDVMHDAVLARLQNPTGQRQPSLVSVPADQQLELDAPQALASAAGGDTGGQDRCRCPDWVDGKPCCLIRGLAAIAAEPEPKPAPKPKQEMLSRSQWDELGGLIGVYAAMARVPSGAPWRVLNQRALASARDRIAELTGMNAEAVQTAFERL